MATYVAIIQAHAIGDSESKALQEKMAQAIAGSDPRVTVVQTYSSENEDLKHELLTLGVAPAEATAPDVGTCGVDCGCL